MSELNEAIKLLDAHCSNRGVDVWNAAATAIAVLRTQAAELERCREALEDARFWIQRDLPTAALHTVVDALAALKGATQ